MNGFINLIKPKDVSSAFAVTSVKKKFNCPCGHMGTLDPMASGVLPVGVGHASRLFQYMLSKDKSYIATFSFGEERDTLDITGEIERLTDAIPTSKELEEVLPKFVGKIMQVPPKYSAKNISGKRGYQLARSGVDFELPPVEIEINKIELLGQVSEREFSFLIDCKGGTYIRSLARDIAYAVGSLGTMTKLERTKSGIFDISTGVDLETFRNCENPERYLIPADTVVNFPKLNLTPKQYKKILDGVYDDLGYEDGLYRVYSDTFIGVGQSEQGILRIKSYVR